MTTIAIRNIQPGSIVRLPDGRMGVMMPRHFRHWVKVGPNLAVELRDIRQKLEVIHWPMAVAQLWLEQNSPDWKADEPSTKPATKHLTWGEFKRLVDLAIEDDIEIWYIDVNFPTEACLVCCIGDDGLVNVTSGW